MGVLAYKIMSIPPDVTIQREWECGTYDLMVESGNADGWTEVSRDCDKWPSRQTLYPYASGMHTGGNSVIATTLDPGIPFQKEFPNTDDSIITELDFSDMNGGVLPVSPCSQMWLYQNGVKMRCGQYVVDYGTATIAIVSDYQVPGAAYEAVYFAPTGGSGGGS